MTARLKGAVIGCGFFAQNHLHGWADLDDVEIVAVCDVDEAKAKLAAEKFGIARVYTSAEALLATETLDFVDIPTTMETHEALTALAFAHGVPVILQKPFAPDLDGCKRMVAAAAAANVPLMIHEDFRFQTLFRTVRAGHKPYTRRRPAGCLAAETQPHRVLRRSTGQAAPTR